MARAAGSKFVSVLCVLLLLLECAGAARGDAPTVCYNFTITPKGSPWCEFEGQVNGKTFLWYNCSQKAKCDCHFLSLTRQHNETCNGEEKTLKDLTEEFQKILPDKKANHTLKVEMTCLLEDNGRAYGSLYLYVNGIKALHFDAKNGNGTPLNSEGRPLNDELKNDQHMKRFLRDNTPEMCKQWYKKVWNHRDNAPNAAAPVTSGPTREPPTSASDTDQSKNVKINWIIGIGIIGIIGIISLIFHRDHVVYICRRWCCRQPARQEAPSGGRGGQDEEASFLEIPEIPASPHAANHVTASLQQTGERDP